jgi:hypothetical protein
MFIFCPAWMRGIPEFLFFIAPNWLFGEALAQKNADKDCRFAIARQ